MKKVLLLAALLVAFQGKAIDFDDDAIEQGYRGFVDFGYSLGVGENGKDIDRVNLSTSHGYQIAPQFFAGAGVGLNYFYDCEKVNMPIFAHLRSDFLNSDVTPFAEVRVGYSVFDVAGFYLNPAVGCRFSLSDDIAMNLSVGYTMQKYDVAHELFPEFTGGGYYRFLTKENLGCIDFRIGIEF